MVRGRVLSTAEHCTNRNAATSAETRSGYMGENDLKMNGEFPAKGVGVVLGLGLSQWRSGKLKRERI